MALNFWGFGVNKGKKFIKGKNSDWKSECAKRDVIEVKIDFTSGKGVLGFSRNNEFLGNICYDINPPVYPAVEVKGSLHKFSLIN